MKFFRTIFSKNTYHFLNLSKEVVIAVILVIFPVFYPNIAQADFFSFMSGLAGNKVSAKAADAEYAPNSQNMALLKAVVNVNPSPSVSDIRPILASNNALMAEIGPAGTASDVDNLSNNEISLYVVRSGDTISEIAGMFDVSVNTIIWANDLGKNPSLKEGQTLVILPITGIQHIVKKGETIKGIVAQHKADLDEVLQYNDISLNSSLVVGSTIIIPDAEPAAATVTTTVKTTTASSKLPAYPGYYMRPISIGRESQGIHGHNAVDLAAPVGTPIVASAAGTVIASKTDGGWNGGYGNYVIISHSNGTQTLYAHTSANLVSVGDVVSKGQTIAKIGMTGKTTGPHVHFEIRGAVNPF